MKKGSGCVIDKVTDACSLPPLSAALLLLLLRLLLHLHLHPPLSTALFSDFSSLWSSSSSSQGLNLKRQLGRPFFVDRHHRSFQTRSFHLDVIPCGRPSSTGSNAVIPVGYTSPTFELVLLLLLQDLAPQTKSSCDRASGCNPIAETVAGVHTRRRWRALGR